MGVDFEAIVMYGTDDLGSIPNDIWEKIVKYAKEIDVYMYEKEAKEYGLSELEQAGIKFWFNPYEGVGEDGFYGVGLEIKDMNNDYKKEKKKVEKVFEKLDLGKPKMIKFSRMH